MVSNYFMELIRTDPEPTFKYSYIGAGLIFIGGWLSSVNLVVGPFVVVGGIFALLSVKGVQINPTTQQVKAYFNFMFIKVGSWAPLSTYTHIVLGPNSSSQMLGKFSSTVRTNSYSVYLLGKNNKGLELKEFIEYHLAEYYLNQIATQIGLPTINKVEIIKSVAAEKRELGRR